MLRPWAAVGLVCVMAAACSSSSEPQPTAAPAPDPLPPIVEVGSYARSDTGLLVANIYAAALNSAGVAARVTPLGDSAAAVAALTAGKVHVVVLPAAEAAEAAEADPLADGTPAPGDAATPDDVVPSPAPTASASPSAAPLEPTLAALEEALAPAGIAVLEPAEAADGAGFAVRSTYAELTGVETLSDLAARSGDVPVVLAAAPGCRREPFCAAALTGTYGVELAGAVTVAAERTAEQVAARRATVAQVRSADGSLDVLQMQVLADDRSVLPPAALVPLLAPDVDRAAVRDIVGRTSDRLTQAALRQMDRAVNTGADARSAADAWVTTVLGG